MSDGRTGTGPAPRSDAGRSLLPDVPLVQLHGPLAGLPDSEIRDYGDHPDYPEEDS